MSAIAAVRLWKETRALIVLWGAGLASVLLAGVGQLEFGGALAVLASIALGTWSVGHEFSHRTMSLLLVQPLSRRRQAVEKVTVLALMVSTLILAALGPETPSATLLVAGAAVGLTLAPWFTLRAGNARAGLIFTIALVVLGILGFTLLAEQFARWRPDLVADDRAFRATALRWSVPVVLLAAAVAGWRRFARLEVVDDTGEHLGVTAWWPSRDRSGAAPHRSHPIAALIGKEVALQQSLFVISSLAIVVWLIDWRFSATGQHQATMFAVTLMHGVFVALLAGAMASAEERRLGTLGWQLLQPVSGARQWIIKAGVAMILALVLAFGLPQMIALLNPDALSGRDSAWMFRPEWVCLLLGVVGASLYVSSLAGNGLQALLVAMPFNLLLWSTNAGVFTGGLFTIGRTGLRGVTSSGFYPLFVILTLLAGAGFLLLLLWFAGVNHRSVVRDRPRVGPQILALILYPLLAGIVVQQILQIALD
jgi:hypothetical protein